ncbi:MAG: hypothetical protein A3C47_04595 [Omnitrophica bacterium RIFCSPHIGHO2_02_FULL_51_18]|nr:MAG: hypothetical protein A3C47_04595 [Omnitrophica bacterium RIFCSPHIGHO2_02_FULL_51_18]
MVEPHGGKLVQREALTGKPLDLKGAKRLAVPDSVLMDCEQIATGTYSPITGFMDSAALDSVLADNRLPSGVAWTMPILCQLPAEKADKIGRESLVLTDRAGIEYALLNVSQVYRRDLPALAEKWFGTNSNTHPGVAALYERGDRFVAGEVTLLKRLPSLYAHYQLAPSQSRFIFAHKGWSKVVGFHTRNVAHRIHEHIQKLALDRTNADGLYISPLIGPMKKGDFLPDPILKSYQTMIDFGLYPASRVVLGCFATYPRFCGPREAVFTALCRKNMGCSHFIVGRNHSGVGDFYQDAEYRRLFASLGDIGIQPVFFEEIGYNPAKQSYDTLEGDAVLHAISGTQMRQALRENKPLPPWFMREVVQDMLRADLSANRAVFYE